MKKPKSFQPARSRMEQRAGAALRLPESEQAAFFYCGGRARDEFKAAVESGEHEAVELALEVLGGEIWLRPGYSRGYRAALRRAAAAGRLTPEQKRYLFALEVRYLERLERAAYYSPLSAEQARACRRLPRQRQWMQETFGELPELKHEHLPPVSAPKELLDSLAVRKLLPPALAAQLEHPSRDLCMTLLHAPDRVLPALHYRESVPEVLPETVCYRLEWNGNWRIEPWKEAQKRFGSCLAADGSFYSCTDEWDRVYFGGITPG